MDEILQSRDGAVGLIKLNRADKKNALNLAMWQDLKKAVDRWAADDSIRVILLGSAKAGLFAAGADIAELQGFVTDPKGREENRQAIRDAQTSLMKAPKPVIIAIDGDCIGGGCGLALHGDIRLAHRRARFGITPAKLGLVYPLRDMKRLLATIGPSAAKRLLFTAALIDAPEALRLGLIDQITAGDVMEEALALAQHMAALSPFSLRALKESFIRLEAGQTDDDSWSIDLFLKAHDGADAAEGLDAFLKKRRPVF